MCLMIPIPYVPDIYGRNVTLPHIIYLPDKFYNKKTVTKYIKLYAVQYDV